MLVKIVNGNEERIYECQHVAVTDPILDSSGLPVGVRVVPCPGGPELVIPDEGQVIYQMNNRGDTTKVYRWPPKRKRSDATT